MYEYISRIFLKVYSDNVYFSCLLVVIQYLKFTFLKNKLLRNSKTFLYFKSFLIMLGVAVGYKNLYLIYVSKINFS
jgi:hypothetical protein